MALLGLAACDRDGEPPAPIPLPDEPWEVRFDVRIFFIIPDETVNITHEDERTQFSSGAEFVRGGPGPQAQALHRLLVDNAYYVGVEGTSSASCFHTFEYEIEILTPEVTVRFEANECPERYSEEVAKLIDTLCAIRDEHYEAVGMDVEQSCVGRSGPLPPGVRG